MSASSPIIPRASKLAPAHLKKGMALIDLGQKTAGVRELRDVVKRFPAPKKSAAPARQAKRARSGSNRHRRQPLASALWHSQLGRARYSSL